MPNRKTGRNLQFLSGWSSIQNLFDGPGLLNAGWRAQSAAEDPDFCPHSSDLGMLRLPLHCPAKVELVAQSARTIHILLPRFSAHPEAARAPVATFRFARGALPTLSRGICPA